MQISLKLDLTGNPNSLFMPAYIARGSTTFPPVSVSRGEPMSLAIVPGLPFLLISPIFFLLLLSDSVLMAPDFWCCKFNLAA